MPKDYFHSSKNKLMNRLEWENEHEAYPSLLKLKGQSGFLIPDGYFVKSQARLELLPYEQLHKLPRETGFAHDSDTLRDLRLTIREELSDHPVLKDLPKHNPFDVSQDYFSKSKQKILSGMSVPPHTRIISLFKRTVWYAAAAILVITAGTWAYSAYFSTSAVDEDCNTLACIEKRELMKYKLDQLDNEELYELVNAEKLEQKLNQPSDTLLQFDTNDAALMDFIE